MTTATTVTIEQAREIERAYLADDAEAECFGPWGLAMAGEPAEDIMEAALQAAQKVIDAHE